MRLQGAALVESLRHRLEDAGLSTRERVMLRCQLVKELEDAGSYEEAREALGDFWRGVGERPAVEGLGEREAAEVLMRAGALSGRFGKCRAIEGAQEKAIDLISEGARIFEGLAEPEKVGEAWTEVGFCYWQKGDFEEARIALRKALDLLGESESEVKAVAIVRTALNENAAGRHVEAYRLLREQADLLATFTSDYIRGLHHSTLANVLSYLSADEQGARVLLRDNSEQSFADRALVEQAAAGFHFEQAGHTRHAARVRNNTGYVLFTLGRFEEAHQNLSRARGLFQSLRDDASAAQVDESRARVYLAQGNPAEAERVARGAVAVLERGDDAPQLVQALTTHAAALARLGRYGAAKAALERAIETATVRGDREGAGQAYLTMIEELAEVLPAYDVWTHYEQADDLLRASQRPDTLSRLRACARIVLTVGRRVLRTDVEDGWQGCDLEEEVLRYERDLIKQAMAAEDGHITRAARRLHTSHQNLRNIINGRQRPYLGEEYAPRQRKAGGNGAGGGEATAH